MRDEVRSQEDWELGQSVKCLRTKALNGARLTETNSPPHFRMWCPLCGVGAGPTAEKAEKVGSDIYKTQDSR